MAQKRWNASPAPQPTTITECARRYHAAALALAQTLGLSLQETLTQHRESVTAIFIETSRCELRLAPHVALPPLAGEPSDAAPEAAESFSGTAPENPGGPPEVPLPAAVPADAGLPCGGVLLVDLKPAQLSLLIGKLAHLSQAKGGAWPALLTALQAGRQRRVAAGRKRPVLVTGDGHGR
jgi:hypothetical protein